MTGIPHFPGWKAVDFHDLEPGTPHRTWPDGPDLWALTQGEHKVVFVRETPDPPTGRWTSDVGGRLFCDDRLEATFDSAYTAEVAAGALNSERPDPATSEPTDDEVEAGAKALYAETRHQGGPPWVWAEASDTVRDIYRHRAETTIRAALIREQDTP